MFLFDRTAVYTLSKFKKKNVFHINITLYISDIKSFCYIIAVNFCGTPLISKLKMLYFFSKIMRTVQNCCIIIIQRFFFPVDTHTTHSQLLLFFASMISLFTKHDFFVDSNECHLTYKKLLLNNRLTFRLENLKKKSIKLNNEKKI